MKISFKQFVFISSISLFLLKADDILTIQIMVLLFIYYLILLLPEVKITLMMFRCLLRAKSSDGLQFLKSSSNCSFNVSSTLTPSVFELLFIAFFFSSSWKCTYIHLLPLKGNHSNHSNYCPLMLYF